MPFLAPFVPALIGAGASIIGANMASDSADDAAAASGQGTALTAQAQREALAYTQETEAPLLDARNQGLAGLTGLYGEGGGQYQQDLINRAQNSPLYAQMMGNRQFGEDAILRNASATGGLRSGNVQYNMNDYNTRLSNDALLQSYNQQVQGLEGLSRVQTNTGAISDLIAGIGQTQGQGAIAQGQIRQQGQQNSFNNIMGGVNLGLDAYNSSAFSGGSSISGGNFNRFGSPGNSTYGYDVGGYSDSAGGLGFSDIRLKSNPEYIGSSNGHQIYSWTWNKEAEKLGLSGEAEGVMAHEVMEYDPEAIGEKDGYITVDYAKLGLI